MSAENDIPESNFLPSDLFFTSGEVAIPATAKAFVARDSFKLTTSGGFCCGIHPNFVAAFLEAEGHSQSPFTGSVLRYGELIRDVRDMAQDDDHLPLICHLGGLEAVKVSLFEPYYLMSQQSRGQEGVLLVDGRDNDFYVGYFGGHVCKVRLSWLVIGWKVDTFSLEKGNDCISEFGSRVFVPARHSQAADPLVSIPAHHLEVQLQLF